MFTAAPTSVTNITGFRTKVAGLSLTKDCPIDGKMIAGSKMECALAAITLSEISRPFGPIEFAGFG